VNPADFYMDVIAGKYERKGDAEFQPQDLFTLWSAHEARKRKMSISKRSPITLTQLKEVEPVGFYWALFMYIKRTLVQYNKHKITLLSDLAMQLVAGAVVGSLYNHFQFKELNTMNFMLGLIVGLTTSLAELRVFGGEREVFWRESSPGSGMNLDTLAYFVAKTLVELGRIAILTTAMLVSFYPLANPRTGFNLYFNITYAGALMATGIPIFFSTSMEPKSAQLATVVFILIVNMMAGMNPTLPTIDAMGKPAQYLSRMS
jgi:hypothetical protein